MQRPTTTARFSDEHRIAFPEDSCDDDDDVSDGHQLYKEHSQSITPERLIHLIPIILMLCFLLLWIFSHPVDFVAKNGSTGVQENETLPLDHPLVDFSLLKPVSTSLSPAPQNQIVVLVSAGTALSYSTLTSPSPQLPTHKYIVERLLDGRTLQQSLLGDYKKS